MDRLLKTFLSRVVKAGNLKIVDAEGKVQAFGDGTGDLVQVRFTDPKAERSCILNPGLKVGECYMDGSLVMDEGSIYDFLAVVLSNAGLDRPAWWIKAEETYRYLTRRLRQNNTLTRSRSNVAHHYDLSGDLYRLFLDEDWQYSCAYFETADADLDDAQLAKKRHIAAKLAIEPDMKVLDIGCGWGGMGLYLARNLNADVTGVTLSTEQHERANARASEAGLADRAQFHLKDYRNLDGPFDRIVSVGMFEHVGVGYFPEYFRKCRDLLTDDGVMLLHSIGRFDGPGDTNSWIDKYIFPGGYIPALSEVIPVIESAGLKITDIEILRLHYADTLRAWRERFMARREEAKALYDERFCRMWEFYLAGSETAFRYQDMMVFQIQITKDQEALPLTRNYMVETENRLRGIDGTAVRLQEAGE
ncbi:SAM-dependent methyltransferase [Amorphus orientalis]|uniref:Cyclopropane-fatty-acyl-phospholipid synthase n=1 Tax=Amorphus orientalis TaxID=649198 RepID=A0AAE4ASY9_9HYPH|nr:cyclopropane-fatty-acyl-phospholipid synthase family protein [Amorphus orientalis]MDQ0315612.1 cyclopropane-fatty-acyl-phospholipid synthase [Amorphus orientalis]